MSTCYNLVNHTRREVMYFGALGEIAQDPRARTLVTYYMLTHIGDHISFVPDDIEPRWPFPDGSPDEIFKSYREVTDETWKAVVDRGLFYDL